MSVVTLEGYGVLFAAGSAARAASIAGPRIVGAEAPQMAFEISARVAAATVVFVLISITIWAPAALARA